MQIINISIINQYKHHCSWLIFDYGWSAPSMIKSFHQIFCDSFDLFGGGGGGGTGGDSYGFDLRANLQNWRGCLKMARNE